MNQKSRKQTETTHPKKPVPAKANCPGEDLRVVRHLHGPAITGHVYHNQTRQVADHNEIQSTAAAYAADVIRRLECKDPLEEMLVAQALWTHTRIARLVTLAQSQTQIKTVKVINDACDKASSTYRKLMQTLADYRRPPRTESFVAIRQANVAQQQVVQNVQAEKTNTEIAANEKGCPALPADRNGIAIAAAECPEDKALGENAGPADDRG